MQISFPNAGQTNIKQTSSRNLTATNRSYSSFSKMSQSLIKYGEEQTKIYDKQFSGMENGGKISVEELKDTIAKEFPVYKMVSREPADVVDGQNLLYIDDINLQKMANNPEYRSKVFGLMRREGDSTIGTTNVRLNGEMRSFQTSGSVFSLSDNNESVGGVPYKGRAKSMSMSTSAMSTSRSRSIGKDEDWYEKLLERIRERREKKEVNLENLQEKNQMRKAELKKIDIYQ